jgi:hypothetical protein
MLWQKLKVAVEADVERSKPQIPTLILSAEGFYDVSVTNMRNGKEFFLHYDPEIPCIYVEREAGSDTLEFRGFDNEELCELLYGGLPITVEMMSVRLTREIW